MSVLKVNSHGIDFNVRIVNEGQNYGLNEQLTHEKKDPLVEFYDNRYPHTQYGQFVSRYNLSTLLNRQENTGLCLDGGVSDWSIDSKTMKTVTSWLTTQQPNSLPKRKM